MRTRSHAEPTVVVTVKDPHVVDRDYLAKAVALARGLDCRLALVHVAWSAHARNVALAGRGTARDVRSWLQEDALLGLHRWAARAVEAGAGATPVVLWGWPESDQLVRYVVRTRPRFVLVRSPARRPLGRFFKAYHDWELLRGVPAPLLLVREAGPWRRPRVVAAVDPLHDHEKTADLDERIVGTAAEAAAALGGALHLVHVAALPAEIVVGGLRPHRVAVPPDLRLERRRTAVRELARLGEIHGVPPRRRSLLDGQPVDELARHARRHGAGILALGVVSRSFLRRAILGSTAESLLHDPPCDLLLVKPAGFRPSPRALG